MNQMEVAQSLPLSWTCPASSRWQVLGFGKVGDSGVGVAEVDLDGAVPSDRLVGSDGVVLDPVVLGVGCQVQGVWDLFEEQPRVPRPLHPERLCAPVAGWPPTEGAEPRLIDLLP